MNKYLIWDRSRLESNNRISTRVTFPEKVGGTMILRNGSYRIYSHKSTTSFGDTIVISYDISTLGHDRVEGFNTISEAKEWCEEHWNNLYELVRRGFIEDKLKEELLKCYNSNVWDINHIMMNPTTWKTLTNNKNVNSKEGYLCYNGFSVTLTSSIPYGEFEIRPRE